MSSPNPKSASKMANTSLANPGRIKSTNTYLKKNLKVKSNDKFKADSKNQNNSPNDSLNNRAKMKDSNSSAKNNSDNKNISIFYRPIKRKQPYKPSEVDFHIGVDFESFGKDAPSHSILGGRTPIYQLANEVPNKDTPSPCDYDPILKPSLVSPNPLQHYISRAESSLHGPIQVETEMSNANNRNIDYIDSETYQTLRNKGKIRPTIGSVDHAPKFFSYEMATAQTVPGCTFIPSRELSLNSSMIKIANRKLAGYETDNPGPGEYQPNSQLSKGPMYQLTGPQFRFDWLEDKRGVPSPNQYNPQRLEHSAPMFSIGFKSRMNKDLAKKKKSIAEESTRIALMNAESREIVTAPACRRGNSAKKSQCNYYLPSEEHRPKTRNSSIARNKPNYFSERFNNTSSASRRQREKLGEDKNNTAVNSYSYDYFENSHSRNNEATYSSFNSKCVSVNSNNKNIIPFPIGSFIMKLDTNLFPIDQTRKYLQTHKELVYWVEFIIDQVLCDKPDDAFMYIRQIFFDIKEEDESKNQSPFIDEEYNINQVIVHLKEK